MSNVTPNYSTSGEEEVNRNYKLFIDVYTVGFLCLFGIIGNAISMAVLGRDRSIRRTTGFLLQMLALSDTAFLVTCLFYQSLNTIAKTTNWLPNDARRHWPYYIEPYIWPVASIAQTCTVWLVVVVTADRYVAICKPLQSPQYSTMTRVRAMVGAVWVFAVLYNLPRFFERDIVKVVDPVTSETSYVVVKSAIRNNPIYILVYMTGSFFVARFFVPFAALAFFNTRLIQAIRESNEIQVKSCSRGGGGGKVGGASCALISTTGGRRTSGSVKLHLVSSNGRSNCLRVKERYTLTLVVVVFVFVICAMPDLLLRFWASLNAYFPSVPFPMPALKYVNAVSNMCLTINSCVNFLIYCFVGRRFRLILVQVICYRASSRPGSRTGSFNSSKFYRQHPFQRRCSKSPSIKSADVITMKTFN